MSRGRLVAPFSFGFPGPIATSGSLRAYTAPVVSGTPTVTSSSVVAGASTSALLGFAFSNQPTDGNLDHIALYGRPTGTTNWAFLAKIAPATVSAGIATYENILVTNLLNGTGYDFAASFFARSGAESAITELASVSAETLALPTTYLAGGASTPPALSGAVTFTQANSKTGVSSDILLTFTLDNQPTDGSLYGIAIYEGTSGGTLGMKAVVPAQSGSTATYSNIAIPAKLNGTTYAFACAYVYTNYTQSDQLSLGTYSTNALAVQTGYLTGGAGTAPTTSGVSFAQAASNSGITTDVLLTFTLTNQPTDGSLYGVAIYEGTSGGTLGLAKIIPATAGASAAYSSVALPAKINGTTYAFAVAYVYTNNSQSAQASLGTYATAAVSSNFMRSNTPNTIAYVTDATVEYSFTGTGPYTVDMWWDNGTASTDASVVFPDGTTVNLGHTVSGGTGSYHETNVPANTNYYFVLHYLNGTTTLTVQKTPFTISQFAPYFADGGIVPAAATAGTPAFTASGSGGSGGTGGGGGGHTVSKL